MPPPEGYAADRGWAAQVMRAAAAVEQARAGGYPTPAWLAVGTSEAGAPGCPAPTSYTGDFHLGNSLVGADGRVGLVDVKALSGRGRLGVPPLERALHAPGM